MCTKRKFGVFVSLIFFSSLCFPQKFEKEKIDLVFGASDPDFETLEVPAEWKNESAVILCQKQIYKYELKSEATYMHCSEMIRKRIKLQDKAAVLEFSKFYFISSRDVGIRVEKQDSTTKTIDLSQAVEVARDIKIPSIYKSSYTIKENYKKLAVPDLVPGDIIDFYFKREISTYAEGEKSFPSVVLSLENAYNTVKQKVEVDLGYVFYLNYKSINGAPPLKLVSGQNEDMKKFVIEDLNHVKVEEEVWQNLYRAAPVIKFQVTFSNNLHYISPLLGNQGFPKTTVTSEEITLGIKNQLDQESPDANYFKKMILSYLNSYHKTVTDPKEIARLSYYYFRFIFLVKGQISSTDKTANYSRQFDYDDHIFDELFYKTMAGVMNAKKIKTRLILCPNKNIGTLTDVILLSDLFWIMMLDIENPIYIFPFTPVSNFGEMDKNYNGAESYEMKYDEESAEIRKIKLPLADYTINKETTAITASLNEDLNIISLSKKCTIQGLCKENFYGDVLLTSDYVNYERQMFNDLKESSAKISQLQKDIKETELAEEKAKRLERLKSLAEDRLEVESYDGFSLTQDGRIYEKQDLIFEEKFKVKDLVNKAGNNYIVDIGKLLGGQIKILENKTERKYDIYMLYPRTFNYQINFIIPEGYKGEGAEKLNINKDNETGSFISTATVEGNMLKINISKVYKSDYEKKENWPKMLEFLDAAYNFSEAKILLKAR